MQRYLATWVSITLALVLVAAAFNVLVDPYGIFRLVDRPGFNAVKPTATTRGEMAKSHGVARERPRALVLGNSRSEVGFDPHHRGWPADAQPVFNLSIAATGPTTTLRYLQHALALADLHGVPVRKAVWGVDFTDYLVRPDSLPEHRHPTEGELRLLRTAADVVGSKYRLRSLADKASASLTMRALTDSLQTLAAQRDPFPIDQTALGFNPMLDYVRISREEGYAAVFRQKDLTYLANFASRPRSLFDARGNSSVEWDATREIVRLCHQRGIDLRLVMYPYHAHFQQGFRLAGLWPLFEEWKRQTVRLVADEARAASAQTFPIWDFTGFSRWTSEPVPPAGDLRTKMQWYWESGHFKRELGDLVLDRVWAQPGANAGFGVRLHELNVEDEILRVRHEEERYRASSSAVVSALERLRSGVLTP